MPKYRLISSKMCPYAQRSLVMLREKGVEFDIEYVDLSNKPDWFVELSPTAKVPTLEVVTDDGRTVVLFESLIINEYFEETTGETALPSDPLDKARARAWIEYSTALLQDCFALTAAKDQEELTPIVQRVSFKLDRLEMELDNKPFFLGDKMSLVDAAFVPALQRLKLADELYPVMKLFGDQRPGVTRWWKSIESRPSVAESVPADLRERFYAMIGRDRGGYRSLIGALTAG